MRKTWKFSHHSSCSFVGKFKLRNCIVSYWTMRRLYITIMIMENLESHTKQWHKIISFIRRFCQKLFNFLCSLLSYKFCSAPFILFLWIFLIWSHSFGWNETKWKVKIISNKHRKGSQVILRLFSFSRSIHCYSFPSIQLNITIVIILVWYWGKEKKRKKY